MHAWSLHSPQLWGVEVKGEGILFWDSPPICDLFLCSGSVWSKAPGSKVCDQSDLIKFPTQIQHKICPPEFKTNPNLSILRKKEIFFSMCNKEHSCIANTDYHKNHQKSPISGFSLAENEVVVVVPVHAHTGVRVPEYLIEKSKPWTDVGEEYDMIWLAITKFSLENPWLQPWNVSNQTHKSGKWTTNMSARKQKFFEMCTNLLFCHIMANTLLTLSRIFFLHRSPIEWKQMYPLNWVLLCDVLLVENIVLT